MVQTVVVNRIRKLHFAHREMNQKQLAELTDCTRQTINAIEAEKYAPSLELAFKIAQAFGLRVDDIFF